MLRVVLDANVVVSALIRPEGPPGRVLGHAIRGRIVRAVISSAILHEIRGTLDAPRVRRCLRLPAAEASAFVDALALVADVVPGERKVTVVAADPDDDKYLAAALEGGAAYIVSGDRHLLDVGAYEGVRIVSAREFLDRVERP